MKYVKFLLVLVVLAACGDEDKDDMGTVGLALDHSIGGHALSFDQVQYANAAGNAYGVSNLEYIITRIHLEQADGSRFMLAPQHYRNAAHNNTRFVLNERVPAGTYTALTFTFGSGAAAGGLPNETTFANMAWPEPLGGGYHYMKFEGLFDGDEGQSAFALHTGPSGGADFTFDVVVSFNLTVDGDAWKIALNMDLNEWLAHPNTYDFADFGGIMGNTNAQDTVKANGTSTFSLAEIRPLDMDEVEHGDGGHEHNEDQEDHTEHM
jgi:hypothetical protein